MNDSKEKYCDDLVIAVQRVLLAFRRGDIPTFDQMERMESALFPFQGMKICGHVIAEDCDCVEQNRILAQGETLGNGSGK